MSGYCPNPHGHCRRKGECAAQLAGRGRCVNADAVGVAAGLLVNMGGVTGGRLTQEELMATAETIAAAPRPGPQVAIVSPGTIARGRQDAARLENEARQRFAQARRTRRWRLLRRAKLYRLAYEGLRASVSLRATFGG